MQREKGMQKETDPLDVGVEAEVSLSPEEGDGGMQDSEAPLEETVMSLRVTEISVRPELSIGQYRNYASGSGYLRTEPVEPWIVDVHLPGDVRSIEAVKSAVHQLFRGVVDGVDGAITLAFPDGEDKEAPGLTVRAVSSGAKTAF